MPPSLRRRGHPPPPEFQESLSDSDEFVEEEELEEGRLHEDSGGAGLEEEEDDEVEEEDEALGSPSHAGSLTTHAPIPPNFREISTLASWTVSSSKPGCSVPQLRSPSTSLFWQSDGPQPHYLNIHFFKLVRIVGLRLYLDFEADESYTPTRIVFLAGSGGNDLVEWGEMKLEQPRGWVWADFSGVGETEGEEDSDSDSDDSMPDISTRNYTQNHAQTRDDSEIENTRPEPAGADPEDDAMNTDTPGPAALPQDIQDALTATANPTPAPPNRTQNQQYAHPTPSLHRTHPRRPLHNLTPNSSPRLASPEARSAKLPVLRAHLVQIKILENHQNGKDTHLRGLQIFAKENESEAPREVHVPAAGRKAVGRKSGDFGGAFGGMAGMGGGLRGLTPSSWDVEPSIR